MANAIYTGNGEELTTGLESSAVSDQAVQCARSFAAERRESVFWCDDEDHWEVRPDGRVLPGPRWMSEGQE